MKLKKLFLLSTALLTFSNPTAYCSSANTPLHLTNDTNYSVEISATSDETLSVITHIYFDMRQGNEIRVGNRILFPVTVVKNSVADSSYFYAPKCNNNDADLLKIELDNNTFNLKSCKKINDSTAIIEALDNQFQKILADNPDLNYYNI